ncbi:hypothetical protein AMTRI_Chr01g107370 [Amborella trichopoda]
MDDGGVAGLRLRRCAPGAIWHVPIRELWRWMTVVSPPVTIRVRVMVAGMSGRCADASQTRYGPTVAAKMKLRRCVPGAIRHVPLDELLCCFSPLASRIFRVL